MVQHISDLVGRELKWSKPHWLKMEYELQDEETRVGTLRFRSSLGTLATGEIGEGCWTFKRAGFLQTRATIRRCGEDQDLAVFKNNSWTGGGTLELPDGRRYPANTNFCMTSYEFRSEAGESLVKFRRIGGIVHLSSVVEIQPAATARATQCIE